MSLTERISTPNETMGSNCGEKNSGGTGTLYPFLLIMRMLFDTNVMEYEPVHKVMQQMHSICPEIRILNELVNASVQGTLIRN